MSNSEYRWCALNCECNTEKPLSVEFKSVSEIIDGADPCKRFESSIREAYKGRNRDIVQATGMLQVEAAELAEIFLKNRWYGKEIKGEEIVSEAGDILNFLTFILRETGFTLEDAMENNIKKLQERGWIEE